MKKLMMTLAAATLMAISAQAQVYIGGSIGIGSVKNFNGDTATSVKQHLPKTPRPRLLPSIPMCVTPFSMGRL